MVALVLGVDLSVGVLLRPVAQVVALGLSNVPRIGVTAPLPCESDMSDRWIPFLRDRFDPRRLQMSDVVRSKTEAMSRVSDMEGEMSDDIQIHSPAQIALHVRKTLASELNSANELKEPKTHDIGRKVQNDWSLDFRA